MFTIDTEKSGERIFDTSPDGILSIVSQGESTTVEFKTRFPPADIIARVFAAFANTSGGILLIGVADDGSIEGVPENEITPSVERLHRIASSLLPYPVEIGTVYIQGKAIIYAVVNLAPSHIGPVLSSRGELYKRTGERTVMIPGSALRDEIRQAIKITKPIKKQLTAFVAMSFREEEEPALVDYYRAMERAVKQTELPILLRRMDLVDGDYEISQKIMNEIDAADIVLADFTLNSRNVYFELGYARGKNRRIIQSARKGTPLEFDIRNWRTIFYRNATELEEKLVFELESAYKDIIETIG